MVWATDDGEPALVLVELAEVPRRPIASFDNSRLFADLAFHSTPAALLLEGDAARAAALDALAAAAVVTAHEQLGGAEALMLTARDYALTRKAFGQPIGAFQSVKHRIAELYGLVEIARANCIDAACARRHARLPRRRRRRAALRDRSLRHRRARRRADPRRASA